MQVNGWEFCIELYLKLITYIVSDVRLAYQRLYKWVELYVLPLREDKLPEVVAADIELEIFWYYWYGTSLATRLPKGKHDWYLLSGLMHCVNFKLSEFVYTVKIIVFYNNREKAW